MRAMICRSWGAPDQLRLEELDSPKPTSKQVLIKVTMSCVNYADTIMIKGQYQSRPEFPFAPGLELGGTRSRRTCEASQTPYLFIV